MSSILLVIELPNSIKKILTSICCGLSSVNWREETQFPIFLRSFEKINGGQLLDIQKNLQSIKIPSFTTYLHHLSHRMSKKENGEICVEPGHAQSILELTHQIDNALRPLRLSPEKNSKSSLSHVTLGYFQHVNRERLCDYLTAYALFKTPSFEVSGVSLFAIQNTLKHTIFNKIEEFQI